MFSAVLRQLHIKFHENPPTGNRVFPGGQKKGPTGMTKLIEFFFRKFGQAPEKLLVVQWHC
jgi:hypothetical protein